MNNAFNQMSHYYGVNFSICMSGNVNWWDNDVPGATNEKKPSEYLNDVIDLIPTTVPGIAEYVIRNTTPAVTTFDGNHAFDRTIMKRIKWNDDYS